MQVETFPDEHRMRNLHTNTEVLRGGLKEGVPGDLLLLGRTEGRGCGLLTGGLLGGLVIETRL